jgi:hypothetical protein
MKSSEKQSLADATVEQTRIGCGLHFCIVTAIPCDGSRLVMTTRGEKRVTD